MELTAPHRVGGSELHFANDDDDVYYYIGERLMLEGDCVKEKDGAK